MARRGRTGRYDANLCPAVAWAVAKLGGIEEDVAEALGISLSTLASWKRQRPEFAQALKLGQAYADVLVEDALYRSAVGYEGTETTTTFVLVSADGKPWPPGTPVRVEVTRRHAPPDVRSMIHWLTHRRPKVWRKAPDHEQEPPICGEGLGDAIRELLRERGASEEHFPFALTRTRAGSAADPSADSTRSVDHPDVRD